MLQLAKQALDIGIFTNRADEALAFYRDDLGLRFDHILPLGGGTRQHRLDLHASVLKVNDARDPLAEAPTGYRRLTIAGIGRTGALVDPDGLPVELVDRVDDVADTAITIASADPDAHDTFLADKLGVDRVGPGRYRLGTTLLIVEADAGVARSGDQLAARGLRYLTIQITDLAAEHARLLGLGVEEGMPPLQLGDVAAISFVRDPGGNWIELSQRDKPPTA